MESRLNIELRTIERVHGSIMNLSPNLQFAQIPFLSLCLAHRLVHRFDNLVSPSLMRANLILHVIQNPRKKIMMTYTPNVLLTGIL